LKNENPIRAIAVMRTLTDVTRPVPKRFIILSLTILETTVPPAIIMEIYPAYGKGTYNESYIEGHAEPSNESGSPKLMKDR
jgi:hypothetical protein